MKQLSYMIYAQEHLIKNQMPNVDILGSYDNLATAKKFFNAFKKQFTSKQYWQLTLQTNEGEKAIHWERYEF